MTQGSDDVKRIDFNSESIQLARFAEYSFIFRIAPLFWNIMDDRQISLKGVQYRFFKYGNSRFRVTIFTPDSSNGISLLVVRVRAMLSLLVSPRDKKRYPAFELTRGNNFIT